MSTETSDLVREHTVMLHALISCLARKGIIDRNVYTAEHDWFADRFKQLGQAAAEMAYKDPAPKEPSARVIALVTEIQTHLFEGPCPSSRTTSATSAAPDSSSSTSPPTK